jgi:hypothetical protein
MKRAVWAWTVVAALLAAGCGAGREPVAAGVPSPTAETSSPEPSESPSPSPTPSAIAAPSPSKTKTKTKPPVPVVTCLGYTGKNLPKSTVRQYLTIASQQDEYASMDPAYLPPELGGVRPKVAIPLTMLKAIAAQESGWQSACKANDRLGFGTMQIQPDTVEGINAYFGETWDRMKPLDNVRIAAAYLQQLTVHFGIVYFRKNFDLAHNPALLNVVLAAYNVGRGNVEANGKIHIGPVGTAYYTAVRQQMSPAADCQHW